MVNFETRRAHDSERKKIKKKGLKDEVASKNCNTEHPKKNHEGIESPTIQGF